MYGHDGGKEGYRSAVIFNPKTKTGVVVLTNARTNDRPMDLARHLLFGESPLPPAPAAPSRPKIMAIHAKALNAYAGRYRLESGGVLTVARRQGHLWIDTNGGGISTFFPSSDREFFSNTDDERIVFEVGADGSTTSLVLRAGETAQRGSRMGIEL